MISVNGNARLLWRSLNLGMVCALILSVTLSAKAEEGSAGEEAASWTAITTLGKQTPLPELAPGEQPTEEQIEAYRALETERLEKLMDALVAYRTNYPDGGHVADSLPMLSQTIDQAMASSRCKSPRARELTEKLLAEKDLPESAGKGLYLVKMYGLVIDVEDKTDISLVTDIPQAVAKIKALVTQWEERYPNSAGLGDLRFAAAMLYENLGDSESAMAAYQATVDSKVAMDPRFKEEAQKALKRYEMVGKPVEIKFTAIDGREVDLSAMKGNVVLVDFWATWCPTCITELPDVMKVYEQYHDKGFEIIGVSLDQDKAALEKMLGDKGMTWPQYFDSKGPRNPFLQKFDLQGVPTMWLIGKDGLIKDVNAGQGLGGKVARLLGDEPEKESMIEPDK